MTPVIPAKAGIQVRCRVDNALARRARHLDSRRRGNDGDGAAR
jgi:hypothetical protein